MLTHYLIINIKLQRAMDSSFMNIDIHNQVKCIAVVKLIFNVLVNSV